MKKLLIVCAAVLLGINSASAQDYDVDDLGIFNHFSLGVGLGTTGISLEAAAPITPYVAVRGGVNIFPSVKYDTDLDTDFGQGAQYATNIPDKIDVQGKLSFTTGHLLFDVFPFKSSSFHLTAGAYFGKDQIVDVYNKEPGALMEITQFNNRQGQYAAVPASAGQIGLELGDYFLTPDNNGNVDAKIKVKGFRPYVGLGFGRPVPMKHRFTCNFDMGVQIWGKPEVYLRDQKLTSQDLDGDGGDIIKTVSKVSVWPVLNVRLVGRIL